MLGLNSAKLGGGFRGAEQALQEQLRAKCADAFAVSGAADSVLISQITLHSYAAHLCIRANTRGEYLLFSCPSSCKVLEDTAQTLSFWENRHWPLAQLCQRGFWWFIVYCAVQAGRCSEQAEREGDRHAEPSAVSWQSQGESLSASLPAGCNMLLQNCSVEK